MLYPLSYQGFDLTLLANRFPDFETKSLSSAVQASLSDTSLYFLYKSLRWDKDTLNVFLPVVNGKRDYQVRIIGIYRNSLT